MFVKNFSFFNNGRLNDGFFSKACFLKYPHRGGIILEYIRRLEVNQVP